MADAGPAAPAEAVPIHPVVRDHLEAMTGPMGIWQHATLTAPNRTFGVCTDDVARAVLVDLLHAEILGWDTVATSAWRSLRFLGDAFDPAWQRFRNFRGADGGWARSEPTEDTQGRALLALASALAVQDDPAFTACARDLLELALPGVRRLRALRAISSSGLACIAALEQLESVDPLRADAARVLGLTHGLLRWAFATPMGPRRDPAWPWPEPVLTYEAALVPRAMIVVGSQRGDRRLVSQGLETLDWLIESQTTEEGHLSPVGNAGWWPGGGRRGRFDQQPIEAASLILACRAALDATGRPGYLAAAEMAYAWFLGVNDLGLAIADPTTGGCRDGLERTGVNQNQGAESTIAWLQALETMRSMRTPTSPGPDATPVPQGAAR